MPLLLLPNELLLNIVEFLEQTRDVNNLVKAHSRLYGSLNHWLYQQNIRLKDSSALKWAVEHGKLEAVLKLLNEGANPNKTWKPAKTADANDIFEEALSEAYPRVDRTTSLLLATLHGHTSIVKVLLARDDLHPLTLTPLSVAVFMGDFPVAKLLYEQINNPDNVMSHCPGDYQRSLNIAAQKGHYKLFRMLLHTTLDIDLHKTTGKAHTILCCASIRGHVKITKLLLDRGVDPSRRCSYCEHLPMVTSSRSGNIELVRLLIERTSSQSYGYKDLESGFWGGMDERSAPIMAAFLDLGVNPECPYPGTTLEDYNDTALFTAVNFGLDEIVATLVEKGADVHTETCSGKTAQQIAAIVASLPFCEDDRLPALQRIVLHLHQPNPWQRLKSLL